MPNLDGIKFDVEGFKKIYKGTEEWYLYHSRKNEDALPIVIVASGIMLFTYNGLMWVASIWIWYAIYCHRNNEKLNKNPYVLEKREKYRIAREDLYKQFSKQNKYKL